MREFRSVDFGEVMSAWRAKIKVFGHRTWGEMQLRRSGVSFTSQPQRSRVICYPHQQKLAYPAQP